MKKPILRVRSDPFEAAGSPPQSPLADSRGTFSRADVVDDTVALESPLQIAVRFETRRQVERNLVVTLRTPGHEIDLAMGYLFAESIIQTVDDVIDHQSCQDHVSITLAKHIPMDLCEARRQRAVMASCGVCGKESLEQIQRDFSDCRITLNPDEEVVSSQWIGKLPDRLRQEQPDFAATGGMHGAGLFEFGADEPWIVREDIGRHNAVDKVIGAAFRQNDLERLRRSTLVLSGRVGYELMQKSAMARIPIIVAVGAASQMAIEIANQAGQTLVGFTTPARYNVYSHSPRICLSSQTRR